MANPLFSTPLLFLEKEGVVYTLTLAGGANKANVFNPALIGDLTAALDIVEESSGAAALVITATGNKFFSAGFDLSLQKQGMEHFFSVVKTFFPVLARILTFPLPTISAINGHCFGAGAFLVLATDYSFMSSDTGKFCFPEAAIGMGFGPYFTDLLKAKLPANAIKVLVLQGRRLSALECRSFGVIDSVVPGTELLSSAHSYAKEVAPVAANRSNQSLVKHDIYESTYNNLMSTRLVNPSSAKL